MNMHYMHISVNAEYASARIHGGKSYGHNAAMTKGTRQKHFLREWRKAKPGRTLEMVAAELHMSQPQLGRIERGDSPYNQDLLEALADLYGCTVADLLMRNPLDKSAIWSIWDQARPGERRMIEAAAKAIMETSQEPRNGTNG